MFTDSPELDVPEADIACAAKKDTNPPFLSDVSSSIDFW
jgi:hypothetical protein